MFFHKRQKYEMNMESANVALQNVFAACNKAPNTIPFDKLVLREKLNTRCYDRLLIMVALLLLLTFLSPLAVVPVSGFLERCFVSAEVRLIDDYVEDGYLYLQLEGDNILYEDAYLEKPDGTVIPVQFYDSKKRILCLPYIDDAESNIYIPLKNGKVLHLLLSPQ